MSLTDFLKTLGYDPEQRGQLLNTVRQNFLQLESFRQLPDDRLEKIGCLMQSFMPYVISLVRAANHLLRPCIDRESKNQLSTQREKTPVQVRTPIITPESTNVREPASLEDLRALTRVSSQKLRATK